MTALEPPAMLWDDKIGFGAAYYHEYHLLEPGQSRLDADLGLMVDGDFNVIRVGESVWSTWEPREGEFDLDWLQPVLDAAHAHGIDVIIGTPTYAVPPWLRKAYPETTIHLATDTPKPYGGRQDVDYDHPTFRRLAERVIRKIVGRYADHPAVVGWQVDNEPGLALIHNPEAFAGFVRWCEERYGSVDELNRRWGLTYWSHRLSEWDELWVPEGNTTPSYDLAWRRYQAELTADYISWQTELVRSLVPADQLITTCIAANQPGQDVTVVGEPLSIAGSNIYYAAQAGLELPGPDHLDPLGAPFWIPWAGPAYVAMLADVSRGMKQAPFIVTETNATNIGPSADSLPSWPGQRRQVVWQLLARGARMIEYWHWHTNRHGAETYWGGILGHSLEPTRTYRELADVAGELVAHRDVLAGIIPRSDVGLIVSPESRWAVEAQPPFHGAVPSWRGDDQAFDKLLAHTYRGLFDAGLNVDILAPHQLNTVVDEVGGDVAELVKRWPVLIAVAWYVATDADLALMRSYVAAGGHLVWTPRSGYADDEAVVRAEVMPGALRDLAGLRWDEFTGLRSPVPLTPDSSLTGSGQLFAELLIRETDDLQVLARYDDPFLGDYAAVATRLIPAQSGAAGRPESTLTGRVTTVGVVPDRALSASLASWIADTSLPADPWRAALTATQSHSSATTRADQVLHVVHNWSWDRSSYAVPRACRQLLPGGGQADLAPGDRIDLGSWDVVALLEHPDTSSADQSESPVTW